MTFLKSQLVIWFVLVGFAARGPDDQPAATNQTASNDHTIAVLEFVDKGPSVDLAVLRSALAEMITGDLSQFERLNVVERVRVDQFLKESNLQTIGIVD